jgi:putative addiction module CopG family antidote
MNLTIPPDSQKFIEDRVKSGRYATPEDVVAAALRTLEDREKFADFEPTELDDLLAEGERSIATEGTLDGEEAFRLRREQRPQDWKPAP